MRGTRSIRTLLGRLGPQSGLIAVVLLLAVLLTAFAGSHVDRRTGRSVNNFLNNIHTLMQTATDTSFFAIMAVGMTMVIIWRTPPTEDGQVQAQRIAQAVNEGTDAILISCSDAAKVTGAINDAVDRGVPVMCFDSDAPRSRRFAFYGTEDVGCGRSVMAELARQMGGRGTVAILAGNQNAPNLRKRVEGVIEEAKKHPEIGIAGTFYHIETPQDAAAEVLRVMNAYPEVNGWAMVGGWPLFTKTLLTDLDPKRAKVVAVDALPAQLPYVARGIAPALYAQPTYQWGYVSVKLMVEKLVDGKDVPVINKMDLVRVTKENLGEWARQLKEWGFEDVPDEFLGR